MDAGGKLRTVGTHGLGSGHGDDEHKALLVHDQGFKVQVILGWQQISTQIVQHHGCSPTREGRGRNRYRYGRQHPNMISTGEEKCICSYLSQNREGGEGEALQILKHYKNYFIALSTAFSENGHKDCPFFYSDLGEQYEMIESAPQGTPRQQTLAKAHFLWICGSVSPWFYGPKHGHLRLNVHF